MSVILSVCAECAHMKASDNTEIWGVCSAHPEGISTAIYCNSNEFDECGNGIGFEPDEFMKSHYSDPIEKEKRWQSHLKRQKEKLMEEVGLKKCYLCRNFFVDEMPSRKCTAFKEGIPECIFMNSYKEVECCNGYSYEERNADEYYKIYLDDLAGTDWILSYTVRNVFCEKAAEKGLAEAQMSTGYNYRPVVGLNKDYNKAHYWFHKAAEQKVPEAYFMLGLDYQYGDGCEKNPQKAFINYEIAKNAGVVEAYVSLARCYLEGIGCNVNLDKAINYYETAVEKGCFSACRDLYEIYKEGKLGYVDKAKAEEWSQKYDKMSKEFLAKRKG